MDIIYRYDPYKPIRIRQLATPDDVIKELETGHRRYVEITRRVHDEMVGNAPVGQIVIPSDPLSLAFTHLTGAEPIQAPFALVLGCSDARVPVEQIFDLSPNDLFVVRVAGNVLGIECLGSISYAVHNMGKSLKLIVVLGHSSCGAVGAAVGSYVDPIDYSEIALGHPLRSLVDRLSVAVRGAAGELERLCGPSVAEHPGYRQALVEIAVYLNAALTAYDTRRELKLSPRDEPRVVYAVYDLVGQRVASLPYCPDHPEDFAKATFGLVPEDSEGFAALGAELARCVQAKGMLGPLTV